MIKVFKDPLILDLLLEKHDVETVVKFCTLMSQVARNQGCYSDMDWWEEAAHYVNKCKKQTNEKDIFDIKL